MIYTKEQIIDNINKMSHRDMAILWVDSPVQDPFMDIRTDTCKAYKERFDRLGGMTPEISKQIEEDK